MRLKGRFRELALAMWMEERLAELVQKLVLGLGRQVVDSVI
jgi:hypothetical protein